MNVARVHGSNGNNGIRVRISDVNLRIFYMHACVCAGQLLHVHSYALIR